MTNNNLPVKTHPRTYKAEFTVAVSRLVKIHEIHVDSIPGYIPVQLGVEMKERLVKRRKSPDPHLGRGKGMHPGDQPDAFTVVTGVRTELKNGFRSCKDRLENYPYRDSQRIVESFGNCPGIRSCLKQCIWSVKVLTACYKPDLFTVKIVYHISFIG